jgi:hypothetical protein
VALTILWTIAVAGGAAAGTGGATFTTDESAFLSAHPGLALEDFESGLESAGSLRCRSPIRRGGTPECFPTAGLEPRLRVGLLDLQAFDALVLADEIPEIGLESKAVFGDFTDPDFPLSLFVPGGTTAIGFRILTTQTSGDVAVTVFGPGGAVVDATTVAPAFGGSYLGIEAAQGIFRVDIETASLHAPGVDNVSFDAAYVFGDGFQDELAPWECGDYDADGLTACAGDCHDQAPEVPSGFTVEICTDDLDNDCDGMTDGCCSLLDQGCTAGKGCILLDNWQTECESVLAKVQGELCQFLNDCAAGLQCLVPSSPGSGLPMCVSFCALPDGEPSCGTLLGPGFVCVDGSLVGSLVATPEGVGGCIPDDWDCGSGLCDPWEDDTSCPADCA